VDERLKELEIARRLNDEGVLTDRSRSWSSCTVREDPVQREVHRNNVYNRVSFKLKVKRVVNPPSMLIRKAALSRALSPQSSSSRRRRLFVARSQDVDDEELLERLRELYRKRGLLSDSSSRSAGRALGGDLRQAPSAASCAAYELIGFTPKRDYQYVGVNRFLRALHPQLLAQLVAKVIELGGGADRDPENDLLRINGELSISV